MDFYSFQQVGSAKEHLPPDKQLSIGMPINGTRRWYLNSFNKAPADVLSVDYVVQINRRAREIAEMMFNDGIHTIYSPVMGRALAERGEAYMRFGTGALTSLGTNEALDWYEKNGVEARFYGALDLLPADVREQLEEIHLKTLAHPTTHIIQYGVFADKPTNDLIQRTLRLHTKLERTPTEEDLIQDYYGINAPSLDVWIGTDQPTVFDVPLVLRENTSLYFLQFPTLYLDCMEWRRILYDFLFIRGDEETLYEENVMLEERKITGLGQRVSDFWTPSLE